jgi:hypothetical protein
MGKSASDSEHSFLVFPSCGFLLDSKIRVILVCELSNVFSPTCTANHVHTFGSHKELLPP